MTYGPSSEHRFDMATSSAACLEEVKKLQQQLCENCRKVLLDDKSDRCIAVDEFGNRIDYLDHGRSYGRVKISTGYSLTDDFPRLPKLEASSQQGCGFCGYLREMVLCKHTMEFTEKTYGINATGLECPDIEVNIVISWVFNTPEGPSRSPNHLCTKIVFKDTSRSLVTWSTVTAATGSEDLVKWFRIGATPNVSPSYPYNIEEMKSRIQQCKEHRHALPSVNFAPERLLDVRQVHPKLVSGCEQLSETMGRTPRYAALSYCWGTSEEAAHQLTTTLQTMPERQKGIRYDEMPPVLRDAVRATRSLDIPFLWIDALCIIQGDNSDWDKQCPQMLRIYGHAEVTLVAASSNSCQDSFLEPEAPSTLLPFSPNCRPGLGGLMQVKFSGCTEASLSGTYYSDIYDSRLGFRGWAVQERLLSTRMIIFGRSSVEFYCAYNPSPKGYEERSFFLSKFATADSVFWYSSKSWIRVLDEYRLITGDSFTQPTDLLPALSGLAAFFGSRSKDIYCAGHWHKDLYQSLMWCSAKPSKDPRTLHIDLACSPRPYIVPSWSRLGKGYSVALEERMRVLGNETVRLRAHISQAGENPFGAIRNAELEVRTHTMCLRSATNIELAKFEPGHYPAYGGGTYREEYWHVRFRRLGVLARMLGRQKREFSCCVWVDYDLKENDFRRDAEEWKWVLLGTSKCKSRRGRGPFGLLLLSSHDSKWCRVGIFQVDSPGYRGWAEPQEDHMRRRDFTKCSSVETVMII